MAFIKAFICDHLFDQRTMHSMCLRLDISLVPLESRGEYYDATSSTSNLKRHMASSPTLSIVVLFDAPTICRVIT